MTEVEQVAFVRQRGLTLPFARSRCRRRTSRSDGHRGRRRASQANAAPPVRQLDLRHRRRQGGSDGGMASSTKGAGRSGRWGGGRGRSMVSRPGRGLPEEPVEDRRRVPAELVAEFEAVTSQQAPSSRSIGPRLRIIQRYWIAFQRWTLHNQLSGGFSNGSVNSMMGFALY